MKAITTKYIPATNTKPSRIGAYCYNGKLIQTWDNETTDEQTHIDAANDLLKSLKWEDRIKIAASGWDHKEQMQHVVAYKSVKEIRDEAFIEAVFEIAFGDNAIRKDYTKNEVLQRLKELSVCSMGEE